MTCNEAIFLLQLTAQSNRRFMLDLLWPFRPCQGISRHEQHEENEREEEDEKYEEYEKINRGFPFYPVPDLDTLFQENRESPFLTVLNSDIRFQIYDLLVDLVARYETHVVDIFKPRHGGARALVPLMSVSRETRDDVLLWVSQNTSWLMRKGPVGNFIQPIPTIDNVKYLLKWTSDFGCSQIPSKEVEAWHQFCFHYPFKSPIAPLVIEFHLSSCQDVLSAFRRLFAEPYRIEIAKRRAAVGPLPIAPLLTSIEIVMCLSNADSEYRDLDGWRDWDAKLRKAWRVIWHGIGGCSTVQKCGGLGSCIRASRRRSGIPILDWTLLRNGERIGGCVDS